MINKLFQYQQKSISATMYFNIS